MAENVFDYKVEDNAWCPGCGNFGIRNIMLKALAELSLGRENVVFVSGIGQAAKSPQYYKASYFNGLHGRALPSATGISASNPNLVVIVESGDGDIYGEGGNHFVHAIRRNPNITVIVHDNMVYGLTKGQASPTSGPGMRTPFQVDGVTETPLNPLALAISLDAGFVARGTVGEGEKTKELIKRAIAHRGFSLVDIFQACVSFNKINTHQWFREHTKLLPQDHDPRNRELAFTRSLETDPFPIGVFYENDAHPVFEDTLRAYKARKEPLYTRKVEPGHVDELLARKR